MYAISIDNRVMVTNLSVGITFIVFIAIILYHIIDSLTSTTQWKKALWKTFTLQTHTDRDNREVEQSFVPLHSSVELCESLLI